MHSSEIPSGRTWPHVSCWMSKWTWLSLTLKWVSPVVQQQHWQDRRWAEVLGDGHQEAQVYHYLISLSSWRQLTNIWRGDKEHHWMCHERREGHEDQVGRAFEARTPNTIKLRRQQHVSSCSRKQFMSMSRWRLQRRVSHWQHEVKIQDDKDRPTDQQHLMSQASKQLEVDRTVSGVQRLVGESLCRTCGKMCRKCQDAKMPGEQLGQRGEATAMTKSAMAIRERRPWRRTCLLGHGRAKMRPPDTQTGRISIRVTESRVPDWPPGTSQSSDDCKPRWKCSPGNRGRGMSSQTAQDVARATRSHPPTGPQREQDGDVNVNSDEEGHVDEAELYRQTMECHGRWLMECHEDSSTKLQGLRHKATAPKIATTQRAARGEGVSAGWPPTDHAQTREGWWRSQRTTRRTKAGWRNQRTTRSTRGSARGWAVRRKSEARQEELEQAMSRDVQRDEQTQREPAVRQRQAPDGGQWEESKRATTAGKSGLTAGKDKRTDQESWAWVQELEHSQQSNRRRARGSRHANELGSHDERDRHTAWTRLSSAWRPRRKDEVQFIDEVAEIPEDSKDHSDSTVAVHWGEVTDEQDRARWRRRQKVNDKAGWRRRDHANKLRQPERPSHREQSRWFRFRFQFIKCRSLCKTVEVPQVPFVDMVIVVHVVLQR